MTMIQHHPADDLLLALAAGNLPGGPSLVVASHVEACAQCRRRFLGAYEQRFDCDFSADGGIEGGVDDTFASATHFTGQLKPADLFHPDAISITICGLGSKV